MYTFASRHIVGMAGVAEALARFRVGRLRRTPRLLQRLVVLPRPSEPAGSEPSENSGSIGAVNRNSLSLAFFPRPVGIEVVPVYAENPPCDANNEQPTLWPASSTIWGGLGFNSPPWSGRVTLSPTMSFRQTRSYPVSNGTGQSTLYLWFPPNQGLTSQACQIP
jgi:hypothetical protein